MTAPRAAMALLLFAAGCVASAPPRDRPVLSPELRLDAVVADVVLPGTRIVLSGRGFVPADAGTATARFAGGGREALAPAVFVDERRLEVAADADFLAALGGDGARFAGEVTVTYEYRTGARPQSASTDAAFELRSALIPRLDTTYPDIVYLGGSLALRGSGFLAPSEGGSWATIAGTFTPPGGAARSISVEIGATFRSRSEVTLEIAPGLFGIRPGRFEGTIALTNKHIAAPPASAGAPRPLALELGPTALLEVTPAVRRGQRLVFRGRGFVPKSAPDAQATILRLDGDFTERGGRVRRWRDAAAMELVPDYLSGSEVAYVLRVYQLPTGDLAGLGLVPGTFEGRATPVILRGREEVEGIPLTVRIDILPARQVIFLKYLPGFTDSLRIFGLRNVELEIRQRIREVCERDFAFWNVEFREVRPTDYVEYGVVEIGGPDPNAQGLFGLDNTTGKDLGNLRLNDVIGGYNAETEEQGFLAYGGVFLESFLALSPRHPDPLPIASPWFDRIFDPFREDRGGRPVAAGEYPFSGRSAAIAEAIRVLGNLVGTTVTHEIGHTLGMAIAEGYFHNPVPGPNQIMDSGDERPFEERAEIGGQGPATFEPEHARYLDQILPRDE
jgi:hypothetical protein